MKRLIPLLAATVLVATPALAHDPKLHRGPQVEGKVVSLKGDELEVGTRDGNVAVALSSETKYERGTVGEKATKGDLQAGDRVMVSGHKLESGKFAAAEVMIHGDQDTDEPDPHGHDDDGDD